MFGQLELQVGYRPGQKNATHCAAQHATHAAAAAVSYRPGQKNATHAPATAMALPTQSPVSGRTPSTAQPQR